MGQVVSQFIADYGELLVEGVRDTIIMTAVATLLAYVIGLPVGVLLITSAKKGIRPNAPLNTVLGWIVNIVRSVPFIILLVAIIPLTRLIVGTSLGVPGAIVPLVITAAPFVARVVEQSLAEVDGSLVEAAQSFGASNLQIVFKVLLFESLPSLVRGAALTFITLFGFSAMAGTVGAGGLGDIAIRYGYYRYEDQVMIVTVVVVVAALTGCSAAFCCAFACSAAICASSILGNGAVFNFTSYSWLLALSSSDPKSLTKG